jgi:16S rRNA (cytosine1402-N4)-methyltransferase
LNFPCNVPGFIHKSVMVAEVLQALRPKPGGRYVDGTVGGGGHAAAILTASLPTGWLFGCDRDGDAIEAARGRLAEFAARCELRQGNFAGLTDWVGPGSCDGVLLDLGVSSPQLERAERGFSFQHDGPLDMRMDQRQGLTAAVLVNETGGAELARMLWELGGERQARRLARVIERERNARRIETTGQLAQLIARSVPSRGQRVHPATRVFQALRMAVNDELGALQRGLAAAWAVLRPGGRLAVITFHSGEDRVVKEFARQLSRGYTVAGDVDVPELRHPCEPELRWVSRKGLRPGAAECAGNPRARSAQLRVFEKIYGTKST